MTNPVLVVRVARCAPPFRDDEPVEYLARCDSPGFVSVGRGLSVDEAIDRLLACLPKPVPPRISVIVDPDPGD